MHNLSDVITVCASRIFYTQQTLHLLQCGSSVNIVKKVIFTLINNGQQKYSHEVSSVST